MSVRTKVTPIAIDRYAGGRRITLEVGILTADAELQRIAAYQEFGTSNIPARSFLRSFVDEEQNFIFAALKRIQLASLQKNSNKIRLETKRATKLFKRKIVSRIVRGISPRLKFTTIKAKAKRGQPSTPLIATGRLIRAIDGRIING